MSFVCLVFPRLLLLTWLDQVSMSSMFPLAHRFRACTSRVCPLSRSPTTVEGCPLQPFTPTSSASAVRADRSIQKQPTFGVLHNPLQPLLQVRACHGAARHDGPFVRLDRVQPESLHHVIGLTTGLLSLTQPHVPVEPHPRSWHPKRRSCF